MTLIASAAEAGLTDTRFPGPSFTWTGNASIPDNSTTGVLIELPISGVQYPIADATIAITMSHTWVSDVEAFLIAPSDIARLQLFGRVGARRGETSGVDANLGGEYAFDDFSLDTFWGAVVGLSDNQPVAPGTYRTSTASRLPSGSLAATTSAGGCSTYLSGAFGGLTPAQANGTWKLFVTDRGAADFGNITEVTLTLNYSHEIYRNGFDSYGGTASFTTKLFEELGTNQARIAGSAADGSCTPAQFDLTGDGLTDYVIGHFVGTGGGGPEGGDGSIEWTVRENNLAANGDQAVFQFGTSQDLYLADDFDGDGIDDLMAYTPGDDGVFRIRRSSRPNDVPVVVHFGSNAGIAVDPLQAGDYDGDRVADLAFLQLNPFANGDGPVLFRYQASLHAGSFVRTIDTGLMGVQGEFFAIGGLDWTGNGLADLPIQYMKVGEPGVARWSVFNVVLDTIDTEFDFGLPSDPILPGNYVGSSVPDIACIRSESGNLNWRFFDSQALVESGPIVFGVANDRRISGDYDGDGLDDLAVWRPSATPGLSKFLIRKSTSTASPPLEVPMGIQNDFPLAGSRVH